MDPAYGKAYASLYRTHWWWRAREIVVLREIKRSLAASRELRSVHELRSVNESGAPPNAVFVGWDSNTVGSNRAPTSVGNERDKARNESGAPPNAPSVVWDSLPRILDVGCGDGLFFNRLLEFADVEGIESESALISENNPHRNRIHIGLLDETFQPTAPYDIILMLDVLEHIQHPAPVLRRALELLAPGGHAIITVPAFQGLWTTHDDLNHHFVRYTKRSFHDLADTAGMTIDRERYLFHWTYLPKLGAHYAESILKPKPSVPKTPPRVLNGILAALSVGEAILFENLPLPFGSSLLVTGTPNTNK